MAFSKITLVFLISIASASCRIYNYNSYASNSNGIMDFKYRDGKVGRDRGFGKGEEDAMKRVFFEHENYKGSHHAFEGDTTECLNIPNQFNDKVSSIRQGGCTIVYHHRNCRGHGRKVCGNQEILPEQIRDSISAIKFQER